MSRASSVLIYLDAGVGVDETIPVKEEDDEKEMDVELNLESRLRARRIPGTGSCGGLVEVSGGSG